MQTHPSDIIDEIILKVVQDDTVSSKGDFQKLCNSVYATNRAPLGRGDGRRPGGLHHQKIINPIPNIAFIERYQEMVADGRITPDARVEKIFRKRGVRNQSGIAVISLLTKFWGCPGKCIYCPQFPGLPRSYIPDEPAVMRAQMNEFDPIKQVFNRLRGLRITGHCIDKCDVRIIGGTWSVYPVEYQEMFIRAIYDAHTVFEELEPFIEATSMGTDKFAEFKIREGFKMRQSATLEEAKQRNMTARSRVVGIQIETRPDWIDIQEIMRLRNYDITRVEIGYQTTIDEINTRNKRGHGNAESQVATQLLKDAGFKVCAHMMPNLLGSTPELDKKSLREVFDNPLFRPDELKIYPMMVTHNSELTQLWKQGKFSAYDDETLIELMSELLAMIPPYMRLNRVYRDIPAHEILNGSHLANLRQIAEERLIQRGGKVVDTATREVKGGKVDFEKVHCITREYEASQGKEYMLSFEEIESAPLGRGEPKGGCDSICKSPPVKGGREMPGMAFRRGGLYLDGYKLSDKHFPYKISLQKYAREMRKSPSLAEKRMWYDILKYPKLSKYKFTRQKPLLNFIADFYCPELNLVIEVDGDDHEEKKGYDVKRTELLEKFHINVLRFHNLEVIDDPEGVEKKILKWVNSYQITIATPCPTDISIHRGTNDANSIATPLTKAIPPSQGGNDTVGTLYALLRLRIPSQYFTHEKHFLPVLEGAALIREIHVYGEQVGVGKTDLEAVQHQGIGKKLVQEAEKIVQEKYPHIKKIAVIAGVGVRPYFEKLGYKLEKGYMIKRL